MAEKEKSGVKQWRIHAVRGLKQENKSSRPTADLNLNHSLYHVIRRLEVRDLLASSSEASQFPRKI